MFILYCLCMVLDVGHLPDIQYCILGIDDLLLIGGVGAGLGLVGDVVGGLFSSSAQNSANQTNIQLAREQMQFLRDERLASQEYNTPLAQRQRYEAAGINPYMALGNITSGETQAQTGAATAQVQPNTAIADMVKSIGKAPGDVLNFMSMAEQVESQQEANKMLRVDSMYKNRQKFLELKDQEATIAKTLSDVDKSTQEYKNLRADLRRIRAESRRAELQLKYDQDTYKSRTRQQSELAELTYRQRIGEELKNNAQEIYNEYLPQMQQSELNRLNAAAAQLWADATDKRALAKLHSEQGVTEFTQRVLKNAGLRLDNQQKNIANQYLGEQIRASLDYLDTQIRQGKQDIENPFRYFGNAILGAGAGAAAGGLLNKAPKAVRGFGR